MTHYYAIGDTIIAGGPRPDGAIIISEQQHNDAFAAQISGRQALVIDGELVIRDVPPTPEHAWENGEWVAPPEPEPPIPDPNSPYALYKSTFIERMTPEEAEQFEQELNASELAKLRLMYHAVEYFVSNDPLFAVLHWELVQAFGEERADELLARTS